MPAEDWELSSGLKEDVIMDIHMAQFGYRANYNNGATLLLVLTGTDENQEVFEHILSVGGDWSAPDNIHAVHPTAKRINKSSRYGQWIQACMELPVLWNYLQNTVGPTDASIWENLRLHLHLQNVSQTIRGELVAKDVLLPVEFLGFLQPTPSQPAQVPPSVPMPTVPIIQAQQPILQPPPFPATPTPVATVPTTGPAPEQSLQPPVAESPIRGQLVQLARALSDHNSFVGQALAVPGVVADAVLVREVMDPNDFFAKARV
jgi:hypothetical protein